jgi:hypothetical protein
MPTLPLRTPALCTRFSPPTASICGLLAVGCELSLRLSPLPATLTRNLQLTENKTTLSLFRATLTSRDKHKSFVCHSYKKQGGWGVPDIAFQIRPSTSNFQLSTSSTCHLP